MLRFLHACAFWASTQANQSNHTQSTKGKLRNKRRGQQLYPFFVFLFVFCVCFLKSFVGFSEPCRVGQAAYASQIVGRLRNTIYLSSWKCQVEATCWQLTKHKTIY